MTLSPQFAADSVDFTSSSTADAETTVAHSLGRVPLEAFVTWRSGNANLYRATTVWDATNIYVKSSVASVQYRIWII